MSLCDFKKKHTVCQQDSVSYARFWDWSVHFQSNGFSTKGQSCEYLSPRSLLRLTQWIIDTSVDYDDNFNLRPGYTTFNNIKAIKNIK